MVVNIHESIKVKNINDKNDLSLTTTIPFIDDLIYDIGLGITGNQILDYKSNGKLLKDKSSKIQKLKPKTELHNIINSALEESGYKKSYEWQYDKIFKTKDNELVEVVKFHQLLYSN